MFTWKNDERFETSKKEYHSKLYFESEILSGNLYNMILDLQEISVSEITEDFFKYGAFELYISELNTCDKTVITHIIQEIIHTFSSHIKFYENDFLNNNCNPAIIFLDISEFNNNDVFIEVLHDLGFIYDRCSYDLSIFNTGE